MTPAESEAAAQALRWLGHSPAAIIAIVGRNYADRESYQPAKWREWADSHPAAHAKLRRLIGQAFARADQAASSHPNRQSAEPLRRWTPMPPDIWRYSDPGYPRRRRAEPAAIGNRHTQLSP